MNYLHHLSHSHSFRAASHARYAEASAHAASEQGVHGALRLTFRGTRCGKLRVSLLFAVALLGVYGASQVPQQIFAEAAQTSFSAPSVSHYSVPFELQDMSFSEDMMYFKKWESGNNYDHGFGKGDGYNALGAFQFDRRYGLATFMQQVFNYDPKTFYMLASVGEKYKWDFETPAVWDEEKQEFTEFGRDLNAAWHAAYRANPRLFSDLQNYYCYRNYYSGRDGVRDSLRHFGFDLDGRSDSVKSLAWGMANLFGKGGGAPELRRGNVWGANKFFAAAKVNANMTDADFVRAVCSAIIDHVQEILPKSQDYWEGYINRYKDEERQYLSHLVFPSGQVNRVYDPTTGEHLFITEKSDLDWYVAHGWKDEGIAWHAPTQSGEIVYRLCNPYSGDHMFTKDVTEVQTMVGNGWIVQSKPFYSASSDQAPIYRLFNPYETFGTHHFTMSQKERDDLVRIGWVDEGIAWYGKREK